MNTYKAHVMKTDVPNDNGMLYSSEVMDKAINQYNEKVEKRTALGELKIIGRSFETEEEYVGRGKVVQLDKVSHLITNIKRTGSDIDCTLQVLNTQNGLILENILKAFGVKKHGLVNDVVTVSSRGIGAVKNKTHVDDYTFIAIDIFPKE